MSRGEPKVAGKRSREANSLLAIVIFIGAILLIAYLGYRLVSAMTEIPPYRKPIEWVIVHIGSWPVVAVTIVILFIAGYPLFRRLQGKSDQQVRQKQLEKRTASKMTLFSTIRWKFMYAFLISIVLTAGLLVGGDLLSGYFIYFTPYGAPFKWVINHIGSAPVMALLGSVLFLVVFFLTSRQSIRYLQQITAGLEEIAKGKLDYELPLRSTDELGMLAYRINQMSRQLDQSIQEERRAEKTKNDLITNVSHDLRTPLTSILGFLELVENDRYKDEVELRYYVNIAYEKADVLKRLIDDLFDYTRISNGLPLLSKPLHMADLIGQLAEEFVPAFEKAGLTCRILTEQQEDVILADGSLLVRAYENLFANALQYGSGGGLITVQIEQVEERLVVRIMNNGEPIPEQDLPYIFDRFYRVEHSRSSRSGGTGLGLAIVKSIVEANGGQIVARSNREETVFETSYPLYSGKI